MLRCLCLREISAGRMIAERMSVNDGVEGVVFEFGMAYFIFFNENVVSLLTRLANGRN